MPASTFRLVLVGLAISGWMVLLFAGFTFGGAIHLLLLAGLAGFPWREPRPAAEPASAEPRPTEEES